VRLDSAEFSVSPFFSIMRYPDSQEEHVKSMDKLRIIGL
jgi:hypothetical protein